MLNILIFSMLSLEEEIIVPSPSDDGDAKFHLSLQISCATVDRFLQGGASYIFDSETEE